MATAPENLPDEPTEASVGRALSRLPTWEQWLEQHGFRYGRSDWSLSDNEWHRNWKDKGRGWMIRVAPERQTISVNVYNTLVRLGRAVIFFNVAERSVPKLVERLIAEIERPVSDQTRKRRIKAFRDETPYEKREDEVPLEKLQPYERPPYYDPQQEAGPLRAPIPDDPNELTPEQLDRVLSRVQVRCFQKGQRVRVRSQRETGLNGELGTVVDAGPHSCYVAIDSYVNMGDPDPFRFEEQELEAIFEGAEDMDSPKPYVAALDWLTPLKQLGYRGPTTAQFYNFTKSLPLPSEKGYLRIAVSPDDELPAASIYVEYRAEGEVERIQDIVVPAIDIVDTVREIEVLARAPGVWGISDFAKALGEKNYPGTKIPPLPHLYYMFGEAIMEAADPDDPEHYFQDLQRHYDVINAFREHGLRMRRRMSADRPYYEMFWIPNAVTDVTYDLKLIPEGDGGWTITATGEKVFEHSRWGEMREPFNIEDSWTIASSNPDEIAVDVDNILEALSANRGPDELSNDAQDYYDDYDESVKERILYPAVWLNGHVYIGPSHYHIIEWLGQQGLLVDNPQSHQEPHHGWWTSAPRYLDSDQDINDLMRIDRRFAQRSGEEPGVKGETLPLARKIGGVRQVESLEDVDDLDYDAYAKGSADWNPVMLLTSKEVRGMIRSAGFKVNSCYKSRITHGWVTTSEPGTPEVFRLMREKSQAIAEYLRDHIQKELIKRFPNLGQTPQGINLDVFDKKIHLSVWQWSGETSADPENPHNYVMYVDIQPADYTKRRRGGGMIESEDPDEIKDVAAYAKGSVDSVTAIQEAGYEYGRDRAGRERWNKYWPLKQTLKRPVPWTPTWTHLWGSPDPWGQYVYGIMSEDFPNATDGGYIIVRPIKQTLAAEDYATSVRRVLLKVEPLMRNVPDTDDLDVVRTYIHDGMRRIRDEVNKEADPTWDVGEALADPDDANAFLKRTHTANMGDLVDVTCPGCGDHRQLFKNWPDNMPGWGSRCEKCGTFIPLHNIVVDDPETVMAHAQTCPRCKSARTRQTGGEGGREYWTCGDCGDKFMWSPDRSIHLEAMDDDVDAAAYAADTLMPDLSEIGYHYDSSQDCWYKQIAPKFQFVVYIKKDALEFNFHVYELITLPNSGLERWQQRGSYGGVSLRKLKDSLLLWEQRVKEGGWRPDAAGALGRLVGEAVAPAPKLRETHEDFTVDDVDPAKYAETTFDPVKFLEASGWFKLKVEAYEYWAKDFPLPHDYVLGGMVFTKLRVVVGFDLRMRGAYSCHVNIHWINDEGNGLPVKGWNLDRQLVTPENELATTEDDYNMPLRRFVMGIGTVLNRVAWPKNEQSTLHANSRLEGDVARFVRELNDQANKPLHGEIGESEDPDAPERYVQALGTVQHVAKLHGMTEVENDSAGGGWWRTFKAEPFRAEHATTPITMLKLVLWYARRTATDHSIRLTVRMQNERGANLVLWTYQGNYEGEHVAARRLSTALGHAIQSLESGPHKESQLFDILAMGVTPFLHGEHDNDDEDG